jgi:hypothetical protein
MGNFRDPTVMAQDARAYIFSALRIREPIETSFEVVLSKLWHALGGLYM